MTDTTRRPARLGLIDLARGVALVAMAVYHLCWDLDFFGFTGLGTGTSPGGRAAAILIAGSFLTLVGVSLVLAHGERIRWYGFLVRLAMLVAGAGAVTAATYVATPDGTVVFGILHCIAVSSLLGLAFLRAPWPITALAAAACIAAPHFLASDSLNGSGWVWLGLGSVPPRTNDYEPLLPWFGCVLAGIALSRAIPPRLLPAPALAGQPARGLRFLGRHSLAFYLVHQPVLFGAVWLAAQVFAPPPVTEETAAFQAECVAACSRTSNGKGDCRDYCTCVVESVQIEGLWSAVRRNAMNVEQRAKVDQIVKVCSR